MVTFVQEEYHNVNIPVELSASMEHREPMMRCLRTPPPPGPTPPVSHLTSLAFSGAFVRLLSLRFETPGQSRYSPSLSVLDSDAAPRVPTRYALLLLLMAELIVGHSSYKYLGMEDKTEKLRVRQCRRVSSLCVRWDARRRASHHKVGGKSWKGTTRRIERREMKRETSGTTDRHDGWSMNV